MRTFFRVMLWLSELELQIARSTGRNPANINELINDVQRWEQALFDLEWRVK